MIGCKIELSNPIVEDSSGSVLHFLECKLSESDQRFPNTSLNRTCSETCIQALLLQRWAREEMLILFTAFIDGSTSSTIKTSPFLMPTLLRDMSRCPSTGFGGYPEIRRKTKLTFGYSRTSTWNILSPKHIL